MSDEQVSPSEGQIGLPGKALATNLTQAMPRFRFQMSPTMGSLVGALAKARKAFKPVVKSSSNPFYKSKYADLAEVIEATKDGLSDNNLFVFQPPAFDRGTGTVEITTIVSHASGEWMISTLDMPVSKTDAQGVGSAITYGRRYAYSAVLNVASEEDDDGNAAVSRGLKGKEEKSEEFDQRTADQQSLKVFEIQAIDEACNRTGKSELEIAAFLSLIGVKRIEHILRTDFQQALKWANTTGKTMPSKDRPKPAAKPTARLFDHPWPKLFATAREKNIPEEDVKQYYRETFKVAHGTELTDLQFTQVLGWVESQ